MGERPLTANAVRRAFVDFFTSRDHNNVPSGSLIPHDETLLFTVAGMVPFKPYFVGEEPAPWPRAVTVQKCVRAGGKHNDLDEVGRTSRHLTFFEMMGNFSFGDYFKSEACLYAWEFITECLGLDPERIWITVHISDDEAASIWEKEVGIPPQRIQRLDEDNYWKMADTGPCGPCSEIFWDKGPEFGADGGPLNGGEERFIEIWNLVFMQFEQQENGSLIPLPEPSIDTGAGLERILSVLQGVDSVWETDEFAQMLVAISGLTGVTYGDKEHTDVSMRILADHARSSSFLISDGVFPSNEDRGYVLRRIIRRAVRHAWLLGVEDPIMPALVAQVVALMGVDYPDLQSNHDFVIDVVDREERRFRETLRSGLVILDEALQDLSAGNVLGGHLAFKLHDTYGFPLEVTQEICAERSVEVDLEGFQSSMEEQQNRARASRKEASKNFEDSELRTLLEKHGPTRFVGREESEIDAIVLYGDENTVVLDRTPFYAEAGGQIGDTGIISTPSGDLMVSDTNLVLGALHVHRIDHSAVELEPGQKVRATIDGGRRLSICRNHTATHILHWALREVLGDHVKQQGSYVAPDRLRFDFSHFEAMTWEQIEDVENLANREVLANHRCDHSEMTHEEALAMGAIAFFGDKYGEAVRVLEAGPNSLEFCGGTHVVALGDIGMIKIINEGSIGSNIRRIEAVTGSVALERLRKMERVLTETASLVGVAPDDVAVAVEKSINEIGELRKEVSKLLRSVALARVDELAETAVDGLVVARIDGIDRTSLRDLAMAIRDCDDVSVVVLGAAMDDGGAAMVAVVESGHEVDAGGILDDAAKTIGGGGRPNPEITVIGGKSPENLDKALEQARASALAY